MKKNPSSPWERTCRYEDIVTTGSVKESDWFRLTPVMGLEAAKLWVERSKLDRCEVCHFTEPRECNQIIDRKLVPPVDLIDGGFGAEIFCSERFVDALGLANATGWEAKLVPHATPNPVFGHKLYRLTIQGYVGNIVDTKVYPDEQRLCPKCNRPLFMAPVPPVSFDADGSTGHDICLSSQWFGGASNPWRALLIRGKVLNVLLNNLKPLTFCVEKVLLTGEGPREKKDKGKRIVSKEPIPRIPKIEEVIRNIEETSTSYRHTLLPGAKKEMIEIEFKKLNFVPPPDLERLLAQWNGVKLFNEALVLQNVSGGDARRNSIIRLNKEAQTIGYQIPKGAIAFAYSAYHYMLWTIDPNGIVRGSGREGILYGPDAPLSAWLSDQIADLIYIWDHQNELPWADKVLYG